MYARNEFQSDQISYNDDDKGYMCDVFLFNCGVMVLSVLTTIAVICVATRILYWLLDTKHSSIMYWLLDTKSREKQVEIKIAVFFAFSSTISIFNTIEIISWHFKQKLLWSYM